MIEDNQIFREMLDKYPICRECINLQQDWENQKAFELLISERENIPSELYGSLLTYLYCSDTEDVQYSTLKNAFANTKREDLMYANDLIKLNAMPDVIEIFRGTQDINEKIPRFSWSLRREVARNFGAAHMFKATIKKEEVIAYYSKCGDEEEIIAQVEAGFEMLY